MKNFVRLSAFSLALLSGLNLAQAAKDIETQWSVDVDQRLPNTQVALSDPAIVGQGESALLVLPGRDGWVHVYDFEGSQVRRFPLGVPSDSPALGLTNGNVVVGDIKGRLSVVDPVAGKVVWQEELSSSFTSAPVAIANDFIVQTADNVVYRFSASGEKRWSYTGSQSTLTMYLNSTPLVVDEVIYALLSNGDAVALKAYTGDVIWKRQLVLSNRSAGFSDLRSPLASPLFMKQLTINGETGSNVILAPIFQGELEALSAINGTQSFSLPLSLKATPVVEGDTMYMADALGFLHAYNIEKGNRLWSKKIASSSLLGPVVFDGSLWLSDNHGELYHLNFKGEVIRSKTFSGHIVRLPLATDEGLIVRTDRGEMVLVK